MSAVVVGGGIAGLVAARELLRRGEAVDLFEAAGHPGGMVVRQEVGGLIVDGGAEAFALRTSAGMELCRELGLEVAEPQGQPHIWWPDAPHRWPMADGILGIPGSIDDPALTGALTADELAEAARDLQHGGDRAADETYVGPLVEARLGAAVVERLVAPVTRGVYGRAPQDMELDRFAPGLRTAMLEHGSLLAAVAALRTPGSAAVAQPVGGMFRLVEALAADVVARGGRIHTDRPVVHLRREGSSWEVHTAETRVRAGRVVLAVSARAAAALLEPMGVSIEAPPTHASHQALLVVDHAELGDGPVGSGVLVGRRDPRLVARALTHYSLKWPWVRTGSSDVLRLAYAAAPAREQVLADASLLLGIELEDAHVVDFAERAWEMPSALTATAHAGLLDELSRFDGLAVTGAWVAGNGIAAVVQAAKEVAA